jgi:hypothetical protein
MIMADREVERGKYANNGVNETIKQKRREI